MDCKANEKRGEEKGARGKEEGVKRDKKGRERRERGKRPDENEKKRRKLQVSMGKIRLLQKNSDFTTFYIFMFACSMAQIHRECSPIQFH